MKKNSDKDIQLSFEFDTSNQKIKFLTVTGKCKCGYTSEFKKADIVIEMTAVCPRCKALMVLK